MSDRVKGALLTMGGAACWGISGCMGQYLFTRENMDSTWLVPIRLLLAGLLLCGYYFIKDRKQLFAPWNWKADPRNAIDLLVYGLAGVSCCQFLYFLTIQLSTAGIATILQDLSPVLILLVLCLQQRRTPRLFELCSILLALLGVFLLTTHGSLTSLAVSPAALAAGLVCACTVVIYTMWPKRLQAQYPTPLLQGWAFLLGGLAFHLIFRPWTMGYVPSAVGVIGILVVVLVGNVTAFSLYMSGVPLIGPQRASLYSFAEPVTAAILSTLLLGSPFTLWDALGFGCIFVMLVLLSLPARSDSPAK
ncbi:DMT family transporter [uncultured Subdoligranulum sp.]|uniref:DMT family transporter n=1 Tax=uncultured Subdoligranulum sp. TaxID=512298 RepID=UPI00260C28C8|nr:DMT family transporter [uncultured Subdoligranulum sp.]